MIMTNTSDHDRKPMSENRAAVISSAAGGALSSALLTTANTVARAKNSLVDRLERDEAFGKKFEQGRFAHFLETDRPKTYRNLKDSFFEGYRWHDRRLSRAGRSAIELKLGELEDAGIGTAKALRQLDTEAVAGAGLQFAVGTVVAGAAWYMLDRWNAHGKTGRER